MIKEKPFIKWAGGKRQLIEQLKLQLPSDFGEWDNATYVEPFVGGGAMLFYMLRNFPNIKRAVINDINTDLIICYKTVRDAPDELIKSLQDIESGFLELKTEEDRKNFFLMVRSRYNEKKLTPIENAASFIFLNKTCFNGLYRVNKKGFFNVPFGKYVNPTICDAETIMNDSELLNRVEILNGDFEKTCRFADKNTFFYFDPPYMPISKTESFRSYSRYGFDNKDQYRLKLLCDILNENNVRFMLSNSNNDSINELYSGYYVEQIKAYRMINSNGSKRGRINEVLVRNYELAEHPC